MSKAVAPLEYSEMDIKLMAIALAAAREAAAEQEVPVGAVLVDSDGQGGRG